MTFSKREDQVREKFLTVGQVEKSLNSKACVIMMDVLLKKK